jgi:hypothetical protein
METKAGIIQRISCSLHDVEITGKCCAGSEFLLKIPLRVGNKSDII